MKSLILLLALSSTNLLAGQWSEITFGQIPLTKDFEIIGNLKKALSLKKRNTSTY